MSKGKWIKRGPHKGKRSPYGGTSKTARGIPHKVVGAGVLVARAQDIWDAYKDGRPPRGMQGE